MDGLDEGKPVRVLARGRDATLTCAILGEAGIDCEIDGCGQDPFPHLDQLPLLVAA